MKHSVFLLVCIIGLATACKDEVLPKPKAFLRLEYNQAEYAQTDLGCTYVFDKNLAANIQENKDCSLILDYPNMKGSIYLTYKPVENNLDTLLIDAQRLSYEHVVKADNILEQPFVNDTDQAYGMFYEVSGNAASQSQFYVTDSTRHFVTGSLYFYAKPNYDSILPAAVYLQKDIRRLMESIRWD